MDKIFEEFEKHVPHGHEVSMVLKAHLLMENKLHEFVKARIDDSNLAAELLDRNSPVSSGKGLILLARALANYDEFPNNEKEISWKAMNILNNLRNDLAHILEPNSDSIIEKMKNFIGAMGEDSTPTESADFNTIFYLAAFLLCSSLEIYQQPAVASDFDNLPI